MSKKTVGECAKLIRGVSYKKQDAIQSAKEGYIPLLRANNILNNQLIWDELIYVPSEYVSDSQYVRAGNIIITMSSGSKAHVGKVALANKDYFAAFGAFCGKLVCEEINPKYLTFALQSRTFRQYIESASKGTNINNLKQSHILSYEVEVPQVCEQERIVSKIEELFSKLDASVAELRTAKEKLKVYRQAVLKEALTPEQGWCKCCFSDLMESVRNGYGKKPDDMGEYRILRISSVRPGKVELSDFRCNQTPFKEDDLISENDLLFTRYNGSLEYVGVCACVPQLQEKYAYPDKIIKCTPKLKNPYHSRFLQYSMNQGEARKYIRSKIKTTSGQKGIAGSDIKKVVLWLPELPVQEKIVKMIDEKMSTCDNIEQTIDISLRQAEAMRQSILKHAFEGGL